MHLSERGGKWLKEYAPIWRKREGKREEATETIGVSGCNCGSPSSCSCPVSVHSLSSCWRSGKNWALPVTVRPVRACALSSPGGEAWWRGETCWRLPSTSSHCPSGFPQWWGCRVDLPVMFPRCVISSDVCGLQKRHRLKLSRYDARPFLLVQCCVWWWVEVNS